MDELLDLKQRLEKERPAAWQELPDISLYMDQIISYMPRQLIHFDDRDTLTSAMVNNYIKDGIVPRAEGKRYSPTHLAYLTAVCAPKKALSVRDISNLIQGLGGIAETADALRWLQEEAVKEGLSGVHLQFIRWNGEISNHSGVDGKPIENESALIDMLGFHSVTNYQFVHMTDVNRDYLDIAEDMKQLWDKIKDEYSVPYFPNVSVGWDNNPRFQEYITPITTNNTPENFKKCLLDAKHFCEKNDMQLITVNSWNEWTETSYLEPDDLYGYGYLEAIKEVFGENE